MKNKIKNKLKNKIFLIVLILIVTILLLILIAYNFSWRSKFQVSKFKLKDDYIVGRIKNKTKTAYDLTITFSLSDGGITEDDTCNELIRENETINLECISMDHDGYKVKIKNIEYKKRKAKKLKSGKISVDTLEYYFKDIYEEHTLNMIGISTEYKSSKYPYIKKVEYSKKKDILKISGEFTEDTNYVFYTEEFDTKSGDLVDFYVSISTEDSERLSSVLTEISLMKSLNKYTSNSSELVDALKSEPTGLDKCLKVGVEWCVSSKLGDGFKFYYIEEQ